ncbi:MAG: hypothetical protein Q9164_006232 [Protoblastenia rupestris]
MSTGTHQLACIPTWTGLIETTKDALLIFEACSQGVLQHCSRRPHCRERESLIASGNVFVYEEATSGIKRWTDGIPWSPSRILNNFLICRQLNKPFPPSEEKRANKRTQKPPRPGELYSTPTSTSNNPNVDDHRSVSSQPQHSTYAGKDDQSPDKDSNYSLVGPLVESYDFEEGGLLKKTMTVTVGNKHHRLVSYYSLKDAKDFLRNPRDDPRLKGITISQQLQRQPKFKFSSLDNAGDGTFESQDQHQYGGYLHLGGAHHLYSYGTTMGYVYPAAPSHPLTTRYAGQYDQYLEYWHYPLQQAIR